MDLIREEALIGKEAVEKLKRVHVAIFGIGGVGSFAAEAIARSGIGEITIVDKDLVDKTNVNRQLIALHSTFGKSKVEVMKERIMDINPDAIVHTHVIFYNNESDFSFSGIDYVIDAIDTVSSKLLLIETCHKLNIPIIASMGTGNKLDPTQFEVSDIYKTSVCPLAKVMRRELKKRGIPRLKVVYSKEEPISPAIDLSDDTRRGTPASISFVPPVAGFILAGEVIKDLIKQSIKKL